jgi:integrase
MDFKDLYEAYYSRHALLRLKQPDNVRYWLSAHGEHWEKRDVAQITQGEVQDWFDDLASRSKSSAVRAVNQFSAILNWGIRRKYFAGPNPCQGVEKIKLQARDRFLQPNEIDALRKALGSEPQIYQDFFWLCLLTGARRGNVLSMEWSEIDTRLATWRIPPHKFKNGQSHTIALTAPALAILERRRARQDKLTPSHNYSSAFVFQSSKKEGHLAEPKRAWARIVKRAGLQDLRIHDLRRTLGSYLAIDGQSQYTIGKALGHLDPRSTAIYARLHLEPVRKALEEAHSRFLH